MIINSEETISNRTHQMWKLYSTTDGYVATCDSLGISTEGKTIDEINMMMIQCEELLIADLEYDNRTLEEYIEELKQLRFADNANLRYKS